MADLDTQWVAPTTFRVFLHDGTFSDHQAAVVRVFDSNLLELVKFGPECQGVLAERGFGDEYLVATYAPSVWRSVVRVRDAGGPSDG